VSADLPVPVRPVRAATWVFGAIAALFAACSPFVSAPDRTQFFVWGVAYGLFLAFFVIGLWLALPSRLVLWWWFSSALPFLFMAAWWLQLRLAPEAFLRSALWVSRGLVAIPATWLAVGFMIASWGWMRYLRRSHWRC
jgi:hypothetical protein